MSLNNPIEIIKKGTLGSPNLGTTILGNIPSIPLISPRDYFLQALESWVASPTMSTQWVVLIESFPKLLKQEIIQELENSSGDKMGWNIDIPVSTLSSYFFQRAIGCIFAQGFQAPGQNNKIKLTDSKRGFLGSPYLEGRGANELMHLNFLETNLSFVDAVLRPWTILVSHKGLVARPEDESVKTNISIFQYGRTEKFLSQIPRKVWTFYDCCPININSTEYNYSTDEVEIRTGVQFAYNRYQIYHTTYLPAFTMVDKFTSGGIRDILGVTTL